MAYDKYFVRSDGTATYALVAPRSAGLVVMQAIKSVVVTTMRSIAFKKSVAELSKLDDRVLKDIGVDRGHIPWMAHEAAKTVGNKRHH